MDWKDAYALGIREIDNRHRTLLGFDTCFEQAAGGKS